MSLVVPRASGALSCVSSARRSPSDRCARGGEGIGAPTSAVHTLRSDDVFAPNRRSRPLGARSASARTLICVRGSPPTSLRAAKLHGRGPGPPVGARCWEATWGEPLGVRCAEGARGERHLVVKEVVPTSATSQKPLAANWEGESLEDGNFLKDYHLLQLA